MTSIMWRSTSRFSRFTDMGSIQRGDILVFSGETDSSGHVGIYLGDNHFLHAPRTGAEVRVESMEDSYWVKRYNGARRIIDGN